MIEKSNRIDRIVKLVELDFDSLKILLFELLEKSSVQKVRYRFPFFGKTNALLHLTILDVLHSMYNTLAELQYQLLDSPVVLSIKLWRLPDLLRSKIDFCPLPIRSLP